MNEPEWQALRDALRVHHPIMRSETGPFSGCRCGQARLGEDVIAHVVESLRAALTGCSASQSEEGLVAARIQIERRMMPDGSGQVMAQFDDGRDDGGTPAAVELLGMLEMTKDTVLHAGIYDDEDDE